MCTMYFTLFNRQFSIRNVRCLYWLYCMYCILISTADLTSTFDNNIANCVTQLKLFTLYKLSSSIFCYLWVSECVRHRQHPTADQISTFSNIYRHTSPLLTLYHLIVNTKQYQLILTKYQPVSSYTDPVQSSTTYKSSSRKAQFSQQNNYRTRVRSLAMLVSNWLTHSLTHCCLVNLSPT